MIPPLFLKILASEYIYFNEITLIYHLLFILAEYVTVIFFLLLRHVTVICFKEAYMVIIWATNFLNYFMIINKFKMLCRKILHCISLVAEKNFCSPLSFFKAKNVIISLWNIRSFFRILCKWPQPRWSVSWKARRYF